MHHPNVSEALARIRIQELHQDAALYRLAHSTKSQRRPDEWVRTRIGKATAFLFTRHKVLRRVLKRLQYTSTLQERRQP